MKNISLLILLFCSVNLNAQGVIQEEHKTFYSNGQVKEYCDYNSDEQLTGVWTSYYEDGSVKASGTYSQDKKEGEWKSYHKNSQVKSLGFYSKGKKQKEWKTFHANGVLFETRTYTKDGELVGKIIRYHNTGNKARIAQVKPGGIYQWINEYDLEGQLINEKNTSFKWRTYNDDGSIYRDGEFKDKKKSGKWGFYDEEGNLDFYSIQQDGETIKLVSLFKNGAIKKDITYKNDLPYDEIEYYEETNTVKFEKKHIGDGLEKKYYYKNGQLENKKTFKNDQKEGEWVWYYPNGKINRLENYQGNQPTGEWFSYDENGGLKSKLIWKEKIQHFYDTDGSIIKSEKLD